MQEDREPTAASSDASKAQEAVAVGMEAYLYQETSDEKAFAEETFARALGRAVERYLDYLEGDERVRVLLGLHRPGVQIPEERMLKTPKEKRKPWKPQRISAPPGSCAVSVRAKMAGSSG